MTTTFTADVLLIGAKPDRIALRILTRASFLLAFFLGAVIAIYAQAPVDTTYVVDGVSDTMAYGMGRSVRVNGTVKDGAISLGGDVIVAGRVDGDVAAIGGSVIQLKGASIGGDVIVVGGTYRHEDGLPNRDSNKSTILYAGYEQELRDLIRNPTGMVSPRWSTTYVGMRILAVLFWFVVSLVVTAMIAKTISRGIARLQLTIGRVAIIGVIGAAIIGAGIPFSLHYLPAPLNVLVGLVASSNNGCSPVWSGGGLCRYRSLVATQVFATRVPIQKQSLCYSALLSGLPSLHCRMFGRSSFQFSL